MATFLSRYSTIANALIDGTASADALSAVSDAFISGMEDSEITAKFPLANPPVTRTTLTNEQRAALVVDNLRNYVNNVWLRAKIEGDIAAAKRAALIVAKPL